MPKTEYEYYISWKHEYNRATDLNKSFYKSNCLIEINRHEGLHPEWIGKNCDCGKFKGCTGPI